jgi:cobalt-zinc-cadmium efflux system membrane fusion protein
LIPGSFVDVVFASTGAPESGPAGLVVPRTAIVEVSGKPTVFVADSTPGQFSARGVQTGSGDATSVSVDSGLAAGEQVVVEGALLLKGELVRADLEGT